MGQSTWATTYFKNNTTGGCVACGSNCDVCTDASTVLPVKPDISHLLVPVLNVLPTVKNVPLPENVLLLNVLLLGSTLSPKLVMPPSHVLPTNTKKPTSVLIVVPTV